MSALVASAATLGVNEYLKVLQRARKVLLGSTSIAPTPTLLKCSDVGLLYFLNEKQTLLHKALGSTPLDVADDPALASLKMLTEYVSFIVAGLIAEAESIDALAIRLQQDINEVALELQKVDMEMQYRKQRVGSTVSRVLAQHYKTRVTIPIVHGSDQLDSTTSEELSDFTIGITTLRRSLGDLRQKKKAVAAAQRLLHGSGVALPAVEAEAIVADLPMALSMRKAHHSLRDALIPLQGREDDVPAVVSLIEFVIHMDVGIGAATDDVEAGIMQVKKRLAENEKEARDERLLALDVRNKQLSTSAVKYNEALRRGALQQAASTRQGAPSIAAPRSLMRRKQEDAAQGASETDAFLSLYCS